MSGETNGEQSIREVNSISHFAQIFEFAPGRILGLCEGGAYNHVFAFNYKNSFRTVDQNGGH